MILTNISTLILLRHGDYGGLQGSLTETGKVQTLNLAKSLQDFFIANEEKLLISSNKQRSLESADILKEQLNINKVISDKRFFSLATEQECDKIIELLETQETSHIIITSHLDFIPKACFYLRTFYPFIPEIPFIQRGTGIIIDFRKKETIFI